MASNTPAPWKINWHIACDGNGREKYRLPVTIGPLTVGDSMADLSASDARLMAAAPDLLDALITALPYVEVQEGDEHYKPGAVEKTLKKMRAAIAKADGAE